MKYIYVPVDSRPCNNLFPCQLANLQGVELLMPPRDIMDDFINPSKYKELSQWLFDNCTDDTILILSVDNYVYGSLLNTRENNISLRDCIARMESLKVLKTRFASMKVYVFNVLMRTSISTLSTDGIQNWKLVNQYSQLVYKVELFNLDTDKSSLAKIEKEIPPDVLNTFLCSRNRNATINKMCIEYVHEGVFESALILQEDSTQYGIQKKEQSYLLEMIDKYQLSNKIYIHNGTDEAGCLMTAKAIVAQNDLKPKLSYKYLNNNRETFIAAYEDRPFHENLLSHAEAAGITLYDNDDTINNILLIYTPVDKQYEASLGDGTPPCDYSSEQLDDFAKQVVDYINSGKRVYLLDVAYSNGGQGEILRHINRYINLNQLYGYSAWNTASNALGTILAQVILSQKADIKENYKFTLERLLDDFAYQGVVRKQLEHELSAIGEDTLNLNDRVSASYKLQEMMNSFITTEDIFKDEYIELICELTWPRIFEAKIVVK